MTSVASGSFVVDTSVLTKWFLRDEDLVDEAWELFQAYGAGRIDLIAPFAIYYEVPSSILKATRRGRIERNDARQAIELFVALPLPVVTPAGAALRELVLQSYDLAERLSRSFYDSIFLATALNIDRALLTADKSLFDAAKATALPVAWLGDLDLP